MTAAKPKKAKPEPKPMGRPSSYTPEIAEEICERLAKGEPLAEICRIEDMPKTRTVSDWKRAHEGFAADFARARDEGYDAIAFRTRATARGKTAVEVELQRRPWLRPGALFCVWAKLPFYPGWRQRVADPICRW